MNIFHDLVTLRIVEDGNLGGKKVGRKCSSKIDRDKVVYNTFGNVCALLISSFWHKNEIENVLKCCDEMFMFSSNLTVACCVNVVVF